MSRALDAIRQYLPETDPASVWMSAYQNAKDHYDVIKWPAYIASLAICIGLIFGAGYFLAQFLQPDQIGVRFMSVLGVYDGIALRISVWLTPWLPWPPWFREFGELQDTLRPFTRVLRRKRGEPEDDFA